MSRLDAIVEYGANLLRQRHAVKDYFPKKSRQSAHEMPAILLNRSALPPEQTAAQHVGVKMGIVMKETVERVVKAFAQKHKGMTTEQERRVRDEVSEFVAQLLEKRAAQLARFGGSAAGETETRV